MFQAFFVVDLFRSFFATSNIAIQSGGQPDDDSEDFPEGQPDSAKFTPYLVGAETLEKLEKEIRKLRTMQAEALAGYHEVRYTLMFGLCPFFGEIRLGNRPSRRTRGHRTVDSMKTKLYSESQALRKT